MAKESSARFESAGWGFWLIVFVVLIGPMVFGAEKLVYGTAPWYIWAGIGVTLDVFAASFIAWGVNAQLQARARKRRMQERKKAKKRK